MNDDERKPFEESLIEAFKEIKLMEAGLMPKQTWEEFLAELEEEERQTSPPRRNPNRFENF